MNPQFVQTCREEYQREKEQIDWIAEFSTNLFARAAAQIIKETATGTGDFQTENIMSLT